ncbi:MAG: hypothetical protein JWM11_5462, partial [Planctomycetaceae bacterium]|nr:hypothetical protein [Planctomycetaceae bacterium]
SELFVYVAQTPTGLMTLTPAEFEERIQWKNDPQDVSSRLSF